MPLRMIVPTNSLPSVIGNGILELNLNILNNVEPYPPIIATSIGLTDEASTLINNSVGDLITGSLILSEN